MRALHFLALVPALIATSLQAQQPRSAEARVALAVRADAIWGPLRFLSDDLLEGRGTGTRGGDLAAHYIAAQFMLHGLEPAGDSGTWFHSVPIVTLNPTATFEAAGLRTRLRYREDFVAWSENPGTPRQVREATGGGLGASTNVVTASGELVFVGFGISAPEWNWDDYQGVDLRGKILLVLVNDPGLRDPALFRGRVLTYYGRWTYKLEEAARRGAAAVLLVHNDTMATYGWNTVRNSWTGDQVRLLDDPTSLQVAGWITQNAAAELLRERGHDLAALIQRAYQRGFRPVPTGIEVTLRVESTMRLTTTNNVVGRLPGSDPVLREEVVIIGSHYDHLGIGQPVDGDSIMNGAVDNASGVATMLAVADAFRTSGVRPRRSLLFVGFAAEEKGLLGSAALAARAPVPLSRVAAMLNIDVANLYGRTRDIAVLGADQSTLGAVFEQAARAEGLRVGSDSMALIRGSFFRSDHFPLARAGVPALSWQSGTDFVGREPGWAEQIAGEYNRLRYHQPDDELLPWYTVDGAVQQARVLARVAVMVGNAPSQPTWHPTSEFRAAGEARLRR
ncbi:MAG TPA: M20/M25/M40 family metallo-hydrolase [Gemmatimonadales bacterium]|nr:M20/M25/M40 family metallo-hydrolase [Gemmatimonadales bacterium]